MRWLVALFLLAPPALAQEAQPRLYPPLPGVEYYCTGGTGERHELGEVICITASCQTWMARCEMSQNTPMWRKLQDGCPGVGLWQRLRAAAQRPS